MHRLELHPYFHARYTLRGIFRDELVAEGKARRLADQGMEAYVYEERSPRGSRLLFVAARHQVMPTRRAAGIPQSHNADWEATRMAIEVFRVVVRAASQAGAVRWYKALDVQTLHDALQGHVWHGSAI